MATNPTTHPDLYKSIILGNVPSPGTVTLSGHERKHRWETQRPDGSQGAYTISKGPDVRGFTAEFYLADLDDITEWDAFQALIESTVDGSKPRALAVYHPDLVRNRIGDVVCESVGGFAHDGKGGARVLVKFLEYRPPRPKPAARPAPSNGKVADRNDPNSEAKAEFAALLAQAQAP